MNTVQHITTTVTRHQARMEGPITARDIGDFVHQVNRIFKETKGRGVEYDDDYIVTGDEEGITAVWETKEKKS